MDYHAALGIGAGILQTLSIIPYARSILKGDTHPDATSFFLWTIFSCLAVAAQVSAGASWSLLLLITGAINTFIVLVFCLFGYGYKRHGVVDYVCLVIGVCAIIGWHLSGNPNIALALLLVANVLADIPTVIKTYHLPRTENAAGWYMTLGAGMLSIFASDKLNFANLVFPFYYLIESGIIVTLASSVDRGRKHVLWHPLVAHKKFNLVMERN